MSTYSDLDSVSYKNTDYTIYVRKYGKIASLTFNVDKEVTFDDDSMLKYYLLNNVHIEAIDTYGNFIPIINGLVTQWTIDKDAKTAKFTPILYPFSIPFVSDEDAELDEESANKSLTILTEDIPILDNFCIMEVVDESLLTLDLELFSKGGTVTPVANINTNAPQPDTWYSISGQHLQGKPTAKGVYIHNGKKEVVK